MNSLTIYRKEAWYDLVSLWRMPGFYLPAMAFPVVFYLFFGVLFASGSQPLYLLATYGCFGIMGPAMFNFASSIASDRAQGWLTLKRISPMPVTAYLAAKLASSLVFALLIMTLLACCAVFFAGVSLLLWQWCVLAITLLFGTVPFALIGLILGLTLSDKAAPAIVNLVYLPMAFLSGLWIPVSMLPSLMQNLAWIWPSYHLSQLALKVLDMDQGHSAILHLGCLIVTTILLTLLAQRCFARLSAERPE